MTLEMNRREFLRLAGGAAIAALTASADGILEENAIDLDALLTLSGGAGDPRFSPDSRSLAYVPGRPHLGQTA